MSAEPDARHTRHVLANHLLRDVYGIPGSRRTGSHATGTAGVGPI